MKHTKATLILTAALLLLFGACTTPPPVIPENLSQPEFFQRAQEEADNYRWDNSLLYYQVFLDRFPDDLPNVLAARYEIAFINYKKERYPEAKQGFQALLETYKDYPNPLSVPQWPRVLSQKLIKIIDEKTAVPPPAAK